MKRLAAVLLIAASLAACGHNTFQADYRNCIHVESDTPTVARHDYPNNVIVACDAWNVRQAAQFEKTDPLNRSNK